jgi:DNA-binding CsgD family transcriptional regulator/tetratricopeptide (TPR) repeat protein
MDSVPGIPPTLLRLAVFVDGFTRDAASAVAGEDAARAIPGLVGMGLLHTEATLRLNLPQRFLMDALMRERVLARLAANRERLTLSEAHATHYARKVRSIESARVGVEPPDLAAALDVEGGNIRAALHWLEAQERHEEALDMAAALWPLWLEQGAIGEGRATLLRLLTHPGAPTASPAAGRAAAILALLAQVQGDHALVATWSGVALGIARTETDPRCAGTALYALGLDHMTLGHPAAASDCLVRALALFGDAGDHRGAAWALRHLASIAVRAGSVTALRLAEDGLAIVRPHGNSLDIARLLHTLGSARFQFGDMPGAVAAWREALLRYRREGDVWGMADALSSLGSAACEHGTIGHALNLLRQARAGFEVIGDPDGTALTLGRIGWATHALGDQPTADHAFRECIELARSVGATIQQAGCLNGLTAIQLVRHDLDEASGTLHDTFNLPEAQAPHPVLAETLEWSADLAQQQQNPRACARLLGAAGVIRDDLGIPARPSILRHRESIEVALRRSLSTMDRTEEQIAGTHLGHQRAIALARSLDPRGERPAVHPVPAGMSVELVEPLTSRESDVLRLLAAGRTDQGIAEMLFISPRTVTTHVSHILGKLGVSRRSGAAAWAVRAGIA